MYFWLFFLEIQVLTLERWQNNVGEDVAYVNVRKKPSRMDKITAKVKQQEQQQPAPQQQSQQQSNEPKLKLTKNVRSLLYNERESSVASNQIQNESRVILSNKNPEVKLDVADDFLNSTTISETTATNKSFDSFNSASSSANSWVPKDFSENKNQVYLNSKSSSESQPEPAVAYPHDIKDYK